MLTKKNIYDSFRPLLLLTKFSGFSLFSIDRRTLKVFFSTGDVFLIIFHLVLTITLNYLYWKSLIFKDIHNLETVKSFFPVVAFFNFVVSSCKKLWMFCYRHEFAELLETIHKIDIELGAFELRDDYSERRTHVIKTILLTSLAEIVAATLFYLAQGYYNMNIGLNVFVFSLYGFNSNMIIVNLSMAFILEVELRIKVLRKIIR